MTKENDFTLQELEQIAAQLPWIERNSELLKKVNTRIENKRPRTIRIGTFDVPEPLREAPSHGTPLFVAAPTYTSCVANWTWDSRSGDESLLHRGLLHTTIDDAIIHAKALISLTETK